LRYRIQTYNPSDVVRETPTKETHPLFCVYHAKKTSLWKLILRYIFHFPRSRVASEPIVPATGRIGFEKLKAMASAIRFYRELSELSQHEIGSDRVTLTGTISLLYSRLYYDWFTILIPYLDSESRGTGYTTVERVSVPAQNDKLSYTKSIVIISSRAVTCWFSID
jgi:hypothetical protein